MYNITYVSDDNSLKVELNYTVGHPLKIYRNRGKSWPKTTQCVVTVNGFIKSVGEVTKNHLDPDDLNVAIVLSTKKALLNSNISKDIRKDLWGNIYKALGSWKQKN